MRTSIVTQISSERVTVQWLPAGEIFGDTAKAQADIDGFWSTPGRGDAKFYEGPAGIFAGSDRSHPELASMPTDPAELLAFVFDNLTGGNPPDEQAFLDVCDHLSTGVVPAKLRAAMFGALARIPGVYVAVPAWQSAARPTQTPSPSSSSSTPPPGC
jgi:hypothetical protein